MSPPRFLVDENLSILLPEVAHARGYEATHINHYGLRKSKDWDILRVVAEEDWILTTNNAFEFRGRYQRLEIHPGVCSSSPTSHEYSKSSFSLQPWMPSPNFQMW